jgi:uncharacterized protein (DUF305 family)
MENKNNMMWVGIGGIILGIIIGTFCFSNWNMWGRGGMMGSNQYENKHMMGDGMMMNDKMNIDDMMASMMSSLEGKTGDTFDRAFIEEMIVHHDGAVVMAEKVLEVSTRPELRTLATNIITAQTSEITQMKGWLTEWFKN